MTPRALAFALCGVFAAAQLGASAFAQENEAPADTAESRAVLEEACRDDGRTLSECGCLGDFVETHFSPRELQGAAMVFGDPLVADDPAAALAKLMDAGYTMEDITNVLNRIVALETTAREACAIDDGAPAGR